MSTVEKDESIKLEMSLSRFPDDVQDTIKKMNLDTDGDGKLDSAEMGVVINNLSKTKKDNKYLRTSVAVLVIFALLLTGCVFAASIAAARLAKDTSVDSVSGIMYAKGSESPIKMEPVSIRKDGVNIVEMTTGQLDVLNEVVLKDGAIKFHVKGYAKSFENNQVGLIVEGGSLIYGEEGLISATGVAETMLNLVYPPNDAESVEEGERRLSFVCDGSCESEGSSTNSYTNAVAPSPPPIEPVQLLTAGKFAILSKAGVTTTGTTAVTGDIGTSPVAASYYTGFSLIMDPLNSGEFSTSSLVTGEMYAADYTSPTPNMLTVAVLDMQAAYTNAAGRSNPNFTEVGAGQIDGFTLGQGLYKWGSSVGVTSSLTFSGDANAVWILQIAGDVTIGSGARITLSGGAQAKNIFWQVGGATNFGTTSHVEGVFLSKTLIVFATGSSLNGAALAQTAVTLDSATIVKKSFCDTDAAVGCQE